MKRFVAMVLVLAMLLALGGTAGAACNHYWFDETDGRHYPFKSGSYIGYTYSYSNGENGKHLKWSYGQYNCTQCGALAKTVEALSSQWEACTYVNGRCSCCGSAQVSQPTPTPTINPATCKHADKTLLGTYLKKHLPAASNNDTNHFVDAENTYSCNLCGTVFVEWEEVGMEPHSFEKVRLENENEIITYDHCTECGSTFNREVTVLKCSHSWDGIQGMYNPQFSYTKQAEWYVYSPYPGSTDHSVKQMWTVTCNTCGESVTNVRADYYAAEQCTYQNGVCTKCNGTKPGYTPSTPTPTPTPTLVPVTPAPPTAVPVTAAPATEVPVTPVPGVCDHNIIAHTESLTTFVQKDEENHLMRTVFERSCACGQVDYSETKDAVYPHQFEDGECRLCGYVDANSIVSVTYSEHPHYYRTDFYADGHTEVVENEAGYKLSRELCDECYPVEFNADTLMEMALWAMDAYNTRDLDPSEYPEHLKDAVRFNDIDCLVVPKLTDDGKMCLTISFEGSKEVKDWIQDFTTESNEYGMHSGIAHDFGLFINSHADALLALLNLVRESGGSIQITGHSYGGGMTQLMTYWLLTEFDFPKDRLTAYTFASPVVLSYEVLRDERVQVANVYNIINVEDVVPDVGITAGYDGWWDYFSLADVGIEEGVNLLENAYLGGGVTLSGGNLGTNYYLSGYELDPSAWPYSNPLALIAEQHSMEMYLRLVNDAINGEQRGYMVNPHGDTIDTDESGVKYYDEKLSFYVGKPEK